MLIEVIASSQDNDFILTGLKEIEGFALSWIVISSRNSAAIYPTATMLKNYLIRTMVAVIY